MNFVEYQTIKDSELLKVNLELISPNKGLLTKTI